ncbi:MAG: radical SAM protein [Candidatus Omnitrophota bacterium]|nr:radical SAM protein [Candidatus Omnitrophota bacterium]MBU1928792.1 radical SAM protein [Candidatus Omnitrophota bacterium]MBU2034251.1 radical SAM protein [Candidatus Omnitrophota bacterium]MBU2221519.1 radical SAM protein [Candidatus Omnitrophota bacterium]
MKSEFKYIYGPVPSWRLGSSLGIDLLSQKDKICNFDCVYCQLGPTKEYAIRRKVYVPAEEIIKEMKLLPGIKIDYITFSGRGDATLAANLGDAIKAVKLVREERIAVLTNAALLGLDAIRKELNPADFVIGKLDACSQESLRKINRPGREVEFSRILSGIKGFRKRYSGKLALQIMFIEDNKDAFDKYIYLANYIKPDEVQVNTPLRPCNVKPLTKEDVLKIKDYFISACKGINIISVYDDRSFKDISSISDEETLKRRGKIK